VSCNMVSLYVSNGVSKGGYFHDLCNRIKLMLASDFDDLYYCASLYLGFMCVNV
jgi:hypothetical protein